MMKRLAGNLMAFLGVVPAMALEMNEAPSAEEVSLKREQGAESYAKAGLVPTREVVQIQKQKPKSALSSSKFLVGAFGFTMVPNESIVATGHMVKVQEKVPTEGKLLTWPEFLQKHRGGVRTLPVTNAQLQGKGGIEDLEKTIENAKRSGLTYLTTLNGNPVGLPALTETEIDS